GTLTILKSRSGRARTPPARPHDCFERDYGTNVPAPTYIDTSEHARRCPRGAISQGVKGMQRTWVVAIALACLVMIPVAASAADRTVVGDITKIDGMNVTVKAQGGKEEMVMLSAKTRVNKGNKKADAKALSVGDHVVAYGSDEKSMVNAKAITIVGLPPAK